MKYLHKHKIIHKNLKPENVLIDEQYCPHISDICFKPATNLTIKGQIYMAPELLNNEENYGQEVDVYSFAMLAYELVTGKAPFSELFASKTADSFTKKVTEGYRPKFQEFVPKKMQDLITKCWSFKPSERPSFDEIFDELSKDFTLIGEIVDEDEINDFLSYINNQVNIEEKAIDMNEENKKINEKLKKSKKQTTN